MRAFTVFAIALLSACSPTVRKTEPTDAQNLVDAFVFVKAKNGLCFGVSTTSRLDTGGNTSYTFQVVPVPCAAVGLEP